MKSLIKTLLASALLLPAAAQAQQVKEGIIKVGKHKEKGFVAVSDKSGKGDVKDILAVKLATDGMKAHGKKNKFYAYQGVWPVSGRDNVSIRYKVLVKKHKTTIYFIADSGPGNYITSATNQNAATDIANFLAQIDTTIALNKEVAGKGQSVAGGDSGQGKTDAAKAAHVKNISTNQGGQLQKMNRAGTN